MFRSKRNKFERVNDRLNQFFALKRDFRKSAGLEVVREPCASGWFEVTSGEVRCCELGELGLVVWVLSKWELLGTLPVVSTLEELLSTPGVICLALFSNNLMLKI